MIAILHFLWNCIYNKPIFHIALISLKNPKKTSIQSYIFPLVDKTFLTKHHYRQATLSKYITFLSKKTAILHRTN